MITGLAGLEPSTYRLGGGRSIHLSYNPSRLMTKLATKQLYPQLEKLEKIKARLFVELLGLFS